MIADFERAAELNAILYEDREARPSVDGGPLYDIPVAIKDNIATLRMPTS